ncbi:ATP-dependent DNA helicase [Noviherbaspirillum suwonense]|uniref:Rad3-related DNA helicase n=1 Tax=Noviherbaspirillum suwonense TaxID=1224511 RepID=A0ABY1QAX5_9BURK|nr:ATP-dependent DNA helicase [Noviherbaspirillum suwonense]SMP65184.1 Rad3-related DNA helicase [Noviherbaspirillum suwonense]
MNPITPAAPPPRYTVAVRALCEFTAKAGDLDLRFTPSPTALEGIAGHAVVASRRAAPYESEVSLSGEHGQLLVRGRADGYDPAANRLEEVKTYRGELDAMPDNHRHLHWAQVRIYGWLLCQARGLDDVELALVYFDIGSQRETMLTEKRDAAWLQAYFEDQCSRFQAWAEQELAHRAARDAALLALPFPHAEFRPGQRHLAASVYRTARDGGCLMAQAPTGIGKTVGTLFPLLKACPGQALDKVFFLAAKTSGRALALDALAQIGRAGPPPLRTLELVARDKACEHPDKACHGASCPLAQGFYDRLPAARSAAVQAGVLDQQGLRTVALAHQVCPYYLSMELARWCDVIIGDYNYYFDLSAMLFGLTLSNQWRVAVLVDEAHNMVERARKMYSAELDQHDLKALRRCAPPPLKKPLDKLNRAWNALWRDQADTYQVHENLPDALVHALQQAGTSMTDYLTEHPTEVHEQLQRFYFDVLHFGRVAELFGSHSLFDVTLDAGGRGARLCLRNVVPAPFLKPRLAAAQATAMFSATLNPRPFYTDMLGLDEKTVWVDVESPFDAGQLAVQVVSHISTRYRQREQSAAPIADLVARQYARQPGNYLAFFSSFDYLRQVAALLAERHPEIPFWEQSRGMEEGARNAFLSRFTVDSCGIGFAVLGGAFGEGIDLPGRRLIGAFIATLGLPQINPVNEQMRERMQQTFGAGYDYTYLYPGLQKVVQAAGRVIRTRDDRGVVYLIDDRYVRGEVRRLLPEWWDVKRLRDAPGAQPPGR